MNVHFVVGMHYSTYGPWALNALCSPPQNTVVRQLNLVLAGLWKRQGAGWRTFLSSVDVGQRLQQQLRCSPSQNIAVTDLLKLSGRKSLWRAARCTQEKVLSARKLFREVLRRATERIHFCRHRQQGSPGGCAPVEERAPSVTAQRWSLKDLGTFANLQKCKSPGTYDHVFLNTFWACRKGHFKLASSPLVGPCSRRAVERRRTPHVPRRA